jgi:hypothetical protein
MAATASATASATTARSANRLRGMVQRLVGMASVMTILAVQTGPFIQL